jgi:hypothetical protein
MGEPRWVIVATCLSGLEADFAVEQLKSAGILAVRRDNDTAGLFGSGFQGASARAVLTPDDALDEALAVLGGQPRTA